MKKLLSIIFLFAAFNSFGQNYNPVPGGRNPEHIAHFLGRVAVDSMDFAASTNDTGVYWNPFTKIFERRLRAGGTVSSGTQYRVAYYAATGTTVSEAAAITANRALISDANGVPTHSTASATELTYLVGTTSLVQGQLDAKAPLVSPALTGTPTAPTAAAATNTTQIATTAFVHAERTNAATITNKDLTDASNTIPADLVIAASDMTTAITAGTNKVSFPMPYAMTVTEVVAFLGTVQTSGSTFTVDINENGTTILSTKITVDNTEENSSTAATAPVISDNSLAYLSKITIDVDQIGDGTGKNLMIIIKGTR